MHLAGVDHEVYAAEDFLAFDRGVQPAFGAAPIDDALREFIAGTGERENSVLVLDRRRGQARLRALRGQPHAGHADAAHPRLSRPRQLRVQGQPRAGDRDGRT